MVTFHDCRHHFASWFMMRGGKLQALQAILGPRSLAMTTRYAHLSPDHIRGRCSRLSAGPSRNQMLEPTWGERDGATRKW